jgi:hypothetical protein
VGDAIGCLHTIRGLQLKPKSKVDPGFRRPASRLSKPWINGLVIVFLAIKQEGRSVSGEGIRMLHREHTLNSDRRGYFSTPPDAYYLNSRKRIPEGIFVLAIAIGAELFWIIGILIWEAIR